MLSKICWFAMVLQIENNNNVISVPRNEFVFKKGVGETLFDSLSEFKESVFQIDGVTGEDTFQDFLQRCVRLAIAMRSRGVKANDVITICSHNHLDNFVPLVSGFFLGAVISSTDPILSLDDTKHLLDQVRPKMIFASTDAVNLIENAIHDIEFAPEIVVFGNSTTHSTFFDFVQQVPNEDEFTPIEVANLKKTCAIVFSSGSTGVPKAVCLSHFTLLFHVNPNIKKSVGKITILSYSSSFWITSIVTFMNTIVNGASRMVMPAFDVDQFWKTITDFKVGFAFLSPYQLSKLNSSTPPENANEHSLKFILTAGAPVNHLDNLRKKFPKTIITTSYGLSEAGGGVIGYHLESDAEALKMMHLKPQSCGRPLAGYDIKVVDIETEEALGPNQEGELRIKCEHQMNGYYKANSSGVLDSEGFIKTGDIAYYDEDYCFYIIDRVKGMLKYRNWQIYTGKLEKLLLLHPAVENALVVGLPHPEDGDHALGVVVLKKSASDTSPGDIEKYMDEKVESDTQKLRGGVKIVESIPVTPSGKFNRRYARKLILEGKL